MLLQLLCLLFLRKHFLFLPTFCNICLEIFDINLAAIRVGLVLIDVVAVDACKLLQDIFFLPSSHLLAVLPFFNFAIYLTM